MIDRFACIPFVSKAFDTPPPEGEPVALPNPTTDTTALVTGASAGIGATLARKLAHRGYNVILAARRGDRLKHLADQLSDQHNVRAIAVPSDLTDPNDRAKLIATIHDAGLSVSVLVNNAGFATGGHYTESPTSREVEQVRVLIEAPIELTSAFLPAMVARGEGAILNVSSTAGMMPMPYSAGYSAAKAHVLAFSQALHYEVRRAGVAVTAICPGPVATEFWEASDDSPIGKTVPKFVWVTADDVAEEALKGLERNKRVVVPGTAVRLGAVGSAYVPDAVKASIVAAAMRPR
jgi:uncharacterized protein